MEVLRRATLGRGRSARWTLVKHIHCKDRVYFPTLNTAAHGVLYILDQKKYGGAAKQIPLILQYLLTHIAGESVVLHELHPSARSAAKTEETRTPEEILAGFAFIKERAPRTNQANEALIWVEIQKPTPPPPSMGGGTAW
eukprot:5158105-Amphidinium_carterae.2